MNQRETNFFLEINYDAIIYWGCTTVKNYSRHFTNLNPFMIQKSSTLYRSEIWVTKKLINLPSLHGWKLAVVKFDSVNLVWNLTLNHSPPPIPTQVNSNLTFPWKTVLTTLVLSRSRTAELAPTLQNVLYSSFLCSRRHTPPENMRCGPRGGKCILGCPVLAVCLGST